jgi:hypothetical protein
MKKERNEPMTKCKTITAVVASAAFLAAGLPAMAQIVTSGLVLNLEAGNNPLYPDAWQDLSPSSGTTYPGSGDPPARLNSSGTGNVVPAPVAPAFGEEPGVAFYSFSRTDASVWGTSDNPPALSEPGFILGETWSQEMWLRGTGNQNGGEHQVSGLRSITHTFRFGIGMGTDGGGPYAAPLNNILVTESRGHGSAENGGVGDTGVNLPMDGMFHHLVFTYNEPGGVGSGLLVMYFDNVALDLTAGFVSGTSLDHEPVEIPWTTAGNGFNLEFTRNFRGDISVFRVYDTTLSAANVAQNFAAGPSTTSLPLVPSTLVAAPNAASLSFDTLLGGNYQVETVGDLSSGTWQAKTYTLIGTGGLMWVTDVDTGAIQQNYRVVKLP